MMEVTTMHVISMNCSSTKPMVVNAPIRAEILSWVPGPDMYDRLPDIFMFIPTVETTEFDWD
ncbi:MAG: hypothetical protein ABEJ65_07720 [bacterium]